MPMVRITRAGLATRRRHYDFHCPHGRGRIAQRGRNLLVLDGAPPERFDAIWTALDKTVFAADEKDRGDLFAATPPLEAKKLLFQKAVIDNVRRREAGQKGIKIMFIDV